MKIEVVEILSDQTNAAIMRHPDRHFPGVLVQGDTLYSLCQRMDLACNEIGRGAAGFTELNGVRNSLWELLTHYKVVLAEHQISLPFSEQAG